MIKILKYGQIDNKEIFARMADTIDVSGAVAEIINAVREKGDTALLDYCEKFDGVRLEAIEVPKEEFDEALTVIGEDFLRILKDAAANIREFHQKQVRNGYKIEGKNGIVLGQRVIPLEKVGLYVPGGTAAYPSTVLMDSIPAKIAGCDQIFMVTPPGKNGKISPQVLAAAYVAGIDRVFKVGGAQAVAALAYGTETIPRVDKIVGPGNAFVAEAKKQVFGQVSIDMIAGPSEILVVADSSAKAANVAADMLSQAEHDKLASAVLVTDSMELAQAVSDEIERQLKLLPREEIARCSIDNNGKIIVAEDLETVVEIANEIAPEHLELCIDNPFNYLDKIRNAGSVFMGKYCPEALGDYYAGPNHTLPTSGTARFSSPLSVDDFIKTSQYIYYTEEALEKIYKDVQSFAEIEGLSAHGRSMAIRFEEEE